MKSKYLRLRDKADKLFSKYIRLKAANGTDIVQCYSCGKVMSVKEAQAGHYMSRRYMNTRFLVHNVHPQCPHCNKWLAGNIPLYRKHLVEEYGATEVERIEALAQTKSGVTCELMEYWIAEWKEKIKELLK
ncbi:MAG: hypothetical protein Ta2B_09460 [Termitinemataceae bacterium]|nr:MAG: hypothetical protein Ta2B_09460 [Termitinemataceae bacterium]